MILGVLIFAGACKEEPVYETEALNGRWEVYTAERNGKETTLLNGAFFVFAEDGHLETNITGQDDRAPFSMENNAISYEGPEPMQFQVRDLTSDTMKLATELQGMQFLFHLQRMRTEAQ